MEIGDIAVKSILVKDRTRNEVLCVISDDDVIFKSNVDVIYNGYPDKKTESENIVKKKDCGSETFLLLDWKYVIAILTVLIAAVAFINLAK